MNKLKMDVIEKSRIEGEYFLQYIHRKQKEGITISDWKITPTQSPYDVIFTSGDTTYIAEIKVRTDYSMDYFIQKGAFLELKKIEGMTTKQKQINEEYKHLNKQVEKLYINFCKDGVITYRLDNPWDYQFDWEWLPKNNTNLEYKEWKLVTKLFQFREIIKY